MPPAGGAAGPLTVCAVTLNSPDEAGVLRARLPAPRYRVVELVDKARPDWLRAACASGVRCDALVISGHFNAGDAFYAAGVDRSEHLSIDELERAACSESCPALFAGLDAVYLLGCESLNPDASKYSSAEGESGLARMRRIFAGVPSIYGFAGPAPAGPFAASLLGRYFDAGGGAHFGEGAPDARLLQSFARSSMVRVSGAGAREAAERALICRFHDERTTAAQKLRFVHGLMREGDVRPHVKRIARLVGGLAAGERGDPAWTQAREELAADAATRARYLALASASPLPAERARMIELAAALGWLSAPEREEATIAFARDVLARRAAPGFEEVDLVCGLASGAGTLAGGALPAPGAGERPARAAILACLGDAGAHRQVLGALASEREADVQVARAYLRHRPIRDAGEQRAVVRAVAAMPDAPAKVRALDTLARMPVSDREALEQLGRLFGETRSPGVQAAIAEIFLRSGYRSPELATLLRRHRASAEGEGQMVDVLLGRLDRAQPPPAPPR